MAENKKEQSGYIYLFLVALLFSFGGSCVKLLKTVMSPEYITLGRFVVGIGFLLLLSLIQRRKPKLVLMNKWVLFGGVSKAVSYLMENYALSMGPSYGNVVVWPLQTVLTAVLAVFVLKEKMSRREILCMILCIAGVSLISWNGVSVTEFFSQNAWILLLFFGTSVFAVLHVFSQKMLIGKMSLIDSNLSIFAVSAVIALIPLPISGTYYGGWEPMKIAAFLMFGFVTGIGFYLNAKGMEHASLHVVPIMQSTTIIFSLIWGVTFFHETLSFMTILGTVVFLGGLTLLKTGGGSRRKKE